MTVTFTPSIVTSPKTQGSKAFRISATGDADAGVQTNRWTLRPMGYVAGTPVRFMVDVITEQTGTEGAGGGFSDDFSGYANTAALLVEWPLFNPYTPGASIALLPTGGPTGGPCLELTMPGGQGNIRTQAIHHIAGLTPGNGYTLTGKLWKDWDDRHVADGGEIPAFHSLDGPIVLAAGHVGSSSNPDDWTLGAPTVALPPAAKNTWTDLSIRGVTSSTGDAGLGAGWVAAGSGAMEGTRHVRLADVVMTLDGGGGDPILLIGLQVGGGTPSYVPTAAALTTSDVTTLQADGVIEGDGGIDVSLFVQTTT